MMTKVKTVLLTAIAALGLVALPAAHAQATGSIQGHVNDEVGVPVKDAEVRILPPNQQPSEAKALYTFKTDQNGDYKGTDIAPGTYNVVVFRGTVLADYMQNQDIKAGQTLTENFDMTREAYMKQLTPERRKQVEEFKAKNAAAEAANKNIKNLNATILAVRADLKTASPNYDKDIADAKSATDAKPDEPLLWVLYGDAAEAKAEHDAAADRANKTNPMTDDNVKQEFTLAVDSYKKANDLMAAPGRKADPAMQATIYNQLGNSEAKSGNATDALAAFDKAVSIQPQNAGMFYGNEAAVLFNAHQDDAALQAADKAIAADPNKPLPYYIKGQELLQKATVDKAGKVVAPPGCVEAYNKYLELDPDGPQAAAAKDALTAMGEKVSTHYSAKKGH